MGTNVELPEPDFIRALVDEGLTCEERVEETCQRIDSLTDQLREAHAWLLQFVKDKGTSVGEGGSKKMGRASAIETNTKPTVNQERALGYLLRYKKDLVDGLTVRKVLPKEFLRAVTDDKIPAAAALKCLDPASPSWQLRIADAQK